MYRLRVRLLSKSSFVYLHPMCMRLSHSSSEVHCAWFRATCWMCDIKMTAFQYHSASVQQADSETSPLVCLEWIVPPILLELLLQFSTLVRLQNGKESIMTCRHATIPHHGQDKRGSRGSRVENELVGRRSSAYSKGKLVGRRSIMKCLINLDPVPQTLNQINHEMRDQQIQETRFSPEGGRGGRGGFAVLHVRWA